MKTRRKPVRANSGISGLVALLTGAHFSHHVLTALLLPLIPFIRNEFGLNYAQSGIVTSAFTIAYGIAQLPAGWLADRVGSSYLLLTGITGVAIAGAAVGLSPGFPVLLLALVCLGVAGGGYHPSASTIISRVVRPERRGRALGLHIIGGSTSHFLAPLLAAGFVALLGWRGTFLSLSAPVGLLGLILFVVIRRRIAVQNEDGMTDTTDTAEERDGGDEPGGPDGADNRQSATTGTESEMSGRMSGNRTARLVVFMILTGFISAFIAALIPFIPLYLVDARGVNERVAAAFLSIPYAAGYIGAPLGGYLSDVIGRVRVMVIIGLAAGPLMALIIFAPFAVPLALLLFSIGILMFSKMPTAEAHIAAVAPERLRATVLGIYFFSGMEGSAVLTPLLGAAIDRWGFNTGLIGIGALMLCIASICSVVLYALRRARC